MRVVDLSQTIHPRMQVFPAYPHPSTVLWTKRETYGFEAEAIFMVTHTGTHVDAPYHFDPKGIKVDEVSLERLVGEGLILDMTHKGAKEYITSSDIKLAESKQGVEVKEGHIVIIRTGWDSNLGKDEYLTSYPGVSRDGAEYLLRRRISALGVDTPNPDHPDDPSFPVHNVLLPNGILIIENLTNLGSLNKYRFTFVGVPLRIKGASGSPIRAIAIEE